MPRWRHYFCHSILGRSIATAFGGSWSGYRALPDAGLLLAQAGLLSLPPECPFAAVSHADALERGSLSHGVQRLPPSPFTSLDGFLVRVRRMLSPVRLTRWALCTIGRGSARRMRRGSQTTAPPGGVICDGRGAALGCDEHAQRIDAVGATSSTAGACGDDGMTDACG
jgi:hypothetical protein